MNPLWCGRHCHYFMFTGLVSASHLTVRTNPLRTMSAIRRSLAYSKAPSCCRTAARTMSKWSLNMRQACSRFHSVQLNSGQNQRKFCLQHRTSKIKVGNQHAEPLLQRWQGPSSVCRWHVPVHIRCFAPQREQCRGHLSNGHLHVPVHIRGDFAPHREQCRGRLSAGHLHVPMHVPMKVPLNTLGVEQQQEQFHGHLLAGHLHVPAQTRLVERPQEQFHGHL